jgi:hypothetical protein
MGLDKATGGAATSAAYITSAGAVGGALTLNEIAALVGVVLAVATFAVNLTFKWLHYRLDKWEKARNADFSTD